VSRREFIGTAAQFHELDADGDGFVDADEARRSDQAADSGRSR
jgi:hypothetical protein